MRSLLGLFVALTAPLPVLWELSILIKPAALVKSLLCSKLGRILSIDCRARSKLGLGRSKLVLERSKLLFGMLCSRSPAMMCPV